MSSYAARRHAVDTERRGDARHLVDFPARFCTISAERRGHLANVSPQGARMEFRGDEPPPKNVSGMLMFEDIEVFCKVVWSNCDACGLIFERPLPAKALGIAVSETPTSSGPVARAINIPLGRKRGRLVTGG
ncbi:MAG: PilZ domain-containing protein [Erythrobacter sp.]